MRRKAVITLVFFVVMGLVSVFFLPASAENETKTKALPTYFNYSSEQIQKLKELSSSYSMNEEGLKKWDLIGSKLCQKFKITGYERLRYFTYLYAAQRDAAFLSYNVHSHFEGSIDGISYAISRLFFPEFTLGASFYETDAYTNALTNIILPNFQKRFERENVFDFQFRNEGPGGYAEPVPPSFANVAKWIPWIVRPANIYYPKPPPAKDDKIWNKEVQEVKNAQKNLTDQQLKAIYYWAGLTGEGSGEWRHIANEYLFSHNVPFAKIVLVRSILMMTLADTSIAYMNAKYHYSVIRPNKRDPSIKIVIAVPQHPSYPSGHSTSSTAASTILSFYFPEDTKKWNDTAEEAGASRIWAGIHYPVDDREGDAFGKKIADIVISKESETTADVK